MFKSSAGYDGVICVWSCERWQLPAVIKLSQVADVC